MEAVAVRDEREWDEGEGKRKRKTWGTARIIRRKDESTGSTYAYDSKH